MSFDWKESGVPGENQRRHVDLKLDPSCCEAAALTMHSQCLYNHY